MLLGVVCLSLLVACSSHIPPTVIPLTMTAVPVVERPTLPPTFTSLAIQTNAATSTALLTFSLRETPIPTLAATSTSQPAPPILIYPPDGAVLTESITIQRLEYLSTGFITYVTVTGQSFTARYCVALHGECMPYDFENETLLLPEGSYTWSVFTVKSLGSATSEMWGFQIDTDTSDR
jgi:hypothetical protein